MRGGIEGSFFTIWADSETPERHFFARARRFKTVKWPITIKHDLILLRHSMLERLMTSRHPWGCRGGRSLFFSHTMILRKLSRRASQEHMLSSNVDALL